ncbi:MAG: response regulator [Kiritimatiellia bacterium]|nr:response regulator [Kiritimatiellia bacterium]
MAKTKILLVEDDEDIADIVRFHLEREGWRVESVEDGEAALKSVEQSIPALILLDLMLPEMDGLQVCRTLRGRPETAQVPIVMMTAKSEETDIVLGLELGADDYITKPFSPRVLVARVRSVLRRKTPSTTKTDDPLDVNGIRIDPRKHEVTVKGKAVSLTATEFQVLHYLACHPGWVFTRQQIVDAVKGSDYPVTERSVDVQMVGLRKKLGKMGDAIETVRGVGYRFSDPAR